MTKRTFIFEIEKQKMANERLEKEVSKLKELLEAELKAKENDCHRGNYCSACKHAVLVRIDGMTSNCYCTYGQCNHFEKECHVQDV